MSAGTVQLESEIASLKNQVKDLVHGLPSVSMTVPDEEKGGLIFQAFMSDEPFDRLSFALMPVKISFLDAAFRTCDPEVIACCLFLVKQSLSPAAFEDILNERPRFREMYTRLGRGSFALGRVNARLAPEDSVRIMQEEMSSSSEIMRSVLHTGIDRIKKSDPLIGCEDVDKKWQALVGIRKSRNFAGLNVKGLMKAGWVRKWKSGISPYQGAAACNAWGFPKDIVAAFATQVADAKERADLVERGVIPAAPK